jgi:hypothetical protein
MKGADVAKLQTAINTRLRSRFAPNHTVKVDGVFGPKTRASMAYACYLLGIPMKTIKGIKTGGISADEQEFVLNPGKRNKTQLSTGKKRVAAHRKALAKLEEQRKKAGAKRKRIVEEASKAAANYRKNPGAYHYLAGGVANTVYLQPTPRNWRSDCSQFAASVYKGAGLPSPASVPHEWASTFTMVKCPEAKVVSRAERKPGCLGLYGSRTAPHHVEIWCGDRFIGHGSPPIDSLTPGEPDYYLDFTFLD